MRVLALLLLAGCTDHLLIGVLDPDAQPPPRGPTPIDAGAEAPPIDARVEEVMMSDAAVDEGDGGPLSIALRIFGREDVVSAFANCGAPCSDVEVVMRGGRPPYKVTWADGMLGPQRRMCPGISFQVQEIVSVEDASSQWASLNPIVPLPGGCGEEVLEGSTWQICVEPPLGDGLNCGPTGGLWYALREPVEEAEVSIGASFSVPLFAGTRAELYLASEPCGAQTLLVAGDVNGFTPTLGVTGSTVGTPLRWLVLRAPSEPNGQWPVGIAPAFSVCFTR